MKRLLPLLLMFMTAYAQSGLPAIGQEIPMSMIAIDTPMTIRGSPVSVDFRGGTKQRVETNPDDPINSVLLRVVGFHMTAELPSDGSFSGGTITIAQNDVDVDPKSLLRLTQRSPLRYEQTDVFSFKLEIDQPGSLVKREPLVLTTKDPMKLISTLTQFPPKGDLYQLQNPVDLIDPDNPDVTVVTIQKFPVKIGAL